MGTKMSRIAGMAVLTLGLVAVAYSQPAAAAHGGGTVAIQFGNRDYYTPAYERRLMAPGHYETRCETVLVEPEHKAQRWVPEVYETRIDSRGRPYRVLVAEGHYETVCIPARYEKRETQVWVPACYQDAPVANHRYTNNERPRFSLRGFFGF